MRTGIAVAALMAGLSLPVAGQAEDLALVIGNEDYRNLPDVRSGDDVLTPTSSFSTNGFRVIQQRNASAADMAQALADFVGRAQGADRLLVILNGNFVETSADGYLLPTDAPEGAGLGAVPRIGLPLSVLMPVLAEHPGRAVLVLGNGGQTGEAGPYLTHGLSGFDIPQGVTVFHGDARGVSWFASTALAQPGSRLAEAAARITGLTGAGYLPGDFVLVPEQASPAPAPAPATGGLLGSAPEAPAVEAQFWQATRRADTIAAYDAYLRRYPDGPNAAEARNLINEIRTEPNRPARLAEEALSLTRDQRREIQRDLTLLDFDTRGIDGILGRGSRAAITAWQTRNGFPANGYMTEDQISALAVQADRRAAELEAEAERRKIEQERQDRAYWQATGSVGDEAGLRAYLGRYPDGFYAELAQDRLAAIEAEKGAAAAAQDRAAWDRAVQDDNVQAYRVYLRDFPNGVFADQAKARIDELTEADQRSDETAAAQQAEDALGLNQPTRTLIEGRLEALGLKPGQVDGVFDDRTRRAIRRYQQARNLPVTGYLNQGTVVRILADSILR